MISEQNLQKFIDLYEKKYSVKLSRQEAFNMFSQLVGMAEIKQQNPIFTQERINKFAGLYNILKNTHNCPINKLVIRSKGMALNKDKKRSQPIVDYQSIDDNNGSLNQAFDILFEETLRQIGGLDTL